MAHWLKKIFKSDDEIEINQTQATKSRASASSGANRVNKNTLNTDTTGLNTITMPNRAEMAPSSPITIEQATINYILNKYKKEAYKLMSDHIEKSGIDGLNIDRIQEIKAFVSAVIQVVEDDFFIGYKLLKKRMVKIDNYLFSQYRKDIKLRPNIYNLLMFAQNKRFSNNLRENLTAYFAVIEEMNFEIIHFLEDYYSILEDLEKNPKTTVYLKKDYGIKTYLKEVTEMSQSHQTVNFFTTPSENSIPKFNDKNIRIDHGLNNEKDKQDSGDDKNDSLSL